MKYSLSLLVVMAMAMVTTVHGNHADVGAKIEGVTASGSFCTAEQQYELYEKCVEQVYDDMNDGQDRRLQLRGGGRKLPTCSQCTDQMIGSRGHWCFVYCGGGRRLTVTDDEAHTERFLVSKGQLQKAANECLDDQISNGYECLGNPEDLTIKIFLSE
jgi:hypothetical protein